MVDYIYSMLNNVQYLYQSMNPVILSGAIDVVVVEQLDGSYLSTPFHVRFGKWAVFNTDDKYVDIEINNRKVAFLKMKLGENGVACFVEEMKSDEELPDSLITSPITPTASSDEETNTRNIVEPNARSKTASTPVDKDRPIRYKRTLNLNSDQLKGLRLKFGMNEARFSISTRFQGRTWCSCHIYLLKPSERIVISDIDGTITKSDVLGHIIPAIGGTWAHTNIVDLYGRIQNNGYRIIYLSSRAIGQSNQTKGYLSSVIQNSKTLPNGPVLLSPTSLFTAFWKEVIERKPEEFKIACLTDLMRLFPSKNPFYAGFGNRETDIKSYVAVGIPVERIFTIDPNGDVKVACYDGFKTNYHTMLKDQVVDYFFPPLKNGETHVTAFNYWRIEPAELDNAELEKYENNRNQKQLEDAKKKSQQSGKSRFFSF